MIGVAVMVLVGVLVGVAVEVLVAVGIAVLVGVVVGVDVDVDVAGGAGVCVGVEVVVAWRDVKSAVRVLSASGVTKSCVGAPPSLQPLKSYCCPSVPVCVAALTVNAHPFADTTVAGVT